MKKFLMMIAIMAFAFAANAQTQVWVNGYTKSNGTYVSGYYKTVPNKTTTDNYSTSGNYNPYTGTTGTKTPTYQGTQPVQTGSRGGKYYINSNGNKTYIKQ